jgi:hypothetical protein
MNDLARIVPELLDELRLERVDVLGYSWAAPSPKSWRGALLTVSAGSCCARPARASAGARRARSPRSCWPRPRAISTRACSLSPYPTSRAAAAREPTVLAEQAAARLHRPPDPLGYVYQLYAAARWSSSRGCTGRRTPR